MLALVMAYRPQSDEGDTCVAETNCLYDAVARALAYEASFPDMRCHVQYWRTDRSFCHGLSRAEWHEYV